MALSQKLAGTSISTGKALVLGMAAFGTAAVAALQHHRHSRRYPYSRRDDAAFDAYRGKVSACALVHIRLSSLSTHVWIVSIIILCELCLSFVPTCLVSLSHARTSLSPSDIPGVVAQAGTVRVPTPYHWLEHSEEDEVKLWVDAQNKVTDAHLATCADKKKIEDVRLERHD